MMMKIFGDERVLLSSDIGLLLIYCFGIVLILKNAFGAIYFILSIFTKAKEEAIPVCEYEAFYLGAQRKLGRKFYTLEFGNRVRDEGVKQFAWGVPSRDAFECIRRTIQSVHEEEKKFVTVIDFGAGAGYWSYSIEKYCKQENNFVQVISIDNHPELYQGRIWCNVINGGLNVLKKKLAENENTAIVLLLIWPTWGNPDTKKAVELFQRYNGKKIVYVGEDRNGATAAPDFFDIIEDTRVYEETDHAKVHQWYGREDRLRVFTRI